MKKAAVLTLAVVLAWRLAADGSQLQAPFVGIRDTALVGNVVAAPTDGPSILLNNPAGIAGLDVLEVEVSTFALRREAEYENPAIGYRTSSPPRRRQGG